ncbi:MAG: phosphoglycerate kinase, partial [Candidatus Dojkabacteria bacterium]
NTRFLDGEQSNDEHERIELAKDLVVGSDLYINDAFPDYRIAASTFEVAELIPSFLGKNFAEEIAALEKLNKPARPYIAVLGGAKLSEKIELIGSIATKADKILIGGALTYTILKARGLSVGNSLVEEDKLTEAAEIWDQYKDKLVLPSDHIIVDEFKEPKLEEGYEHLKGEEIPAGKIAVDIGPNTITTYSKYIKMSKTVLWNGPMGVFEWELASRGTRKIMETISFSDTFSVVGGGDSLAAIAKLGAVNFSHISTGGGAMLAYLGEGKFPTLAKIAESRF